MRVDWSDLAYQQLNNAMAYIARDRPSTATRWLQKLLDAAGSLSDFSHRGKAVDGAQRDDIRELIVSPYRIVYRRDKDVVYITMVLHERRDLDAERLRTP